jgi:uncharacterized Tic20 family protein
MNEVLPIKIRLLAAWCHLSGLAWVGTFYLFYYNQGKSQVASEEFNRILAAAMLLLLVPFLSWRFTKRIHDFIDRSGQKLFNYHLSIIIYLLVLLGIFILSCFAMLPFIGAISLNPNSTNSSPIVTIIGSILSGCIWLATNPHVLTIGYTVEIIIAAFYTWQGKIFSYPLAINFLNSSQSRSPDDED